jgi:hypothetical protein
VLGGRPIATGIVAMNRMELRQLAEDRILDAQTLLAAGRWSGAYYLAGYAVECGLKACVLAYVERTGVIFLEKKYSEKCWTHDSEELVSLAGLGKALESAIIASAVFEDHWKVVEEWSELSRYQQKTEVEARKLFEAVNDHSNGVLQWIKGHW